jgi:hypothetical protein
MYSTFCSCCRGETFLQIKSKIFMVQLESILAWYRQKGSIIARDAEILRVCSRRSLPMSLWGAPGYITSVSLTSPLRSCFSNVQSSLWLLHCSLPSSSHRHSTSQVIVQKPFAMLPSECFQKLLICSLLLLSQGLGNRKQPWQTMLFLRVASTCPPQPRPPKERIMHNFACLGSTGTQGWQPLSAWIIPPSHIPSQNHRTSE